MRRFFTGEVFLAIAVLASGCSVIVPSDREMIHQNYLNAQAMNAKVQAIQTPTQDEWCACRKWWQQEEWTWAALDAWAKGEKPQTAGK